MNVAVIEKQQVTKRNLNLRQDLFCKTYATDPEVLGNATKTYMKVYNIQAYETAKAAAGRLLEDSRVTAKIKEYIEIDGFNDNAVDKKHNFLIHQNKDFNVSLKAVQEYNKLKKRVSNQIELVIPRPLMELDDDEVIHKIDKSKSRDVSQNVIPDTDV